MNHDLSTHEAGVRAQCGPIKSVWIQVCDPDQIHSPPPTLITFRWFRRNSFLRQLVTARRPRSRAVFGSVFPRDPPPRWRCARALLTSSSSDLACHMWSPEIDCIQPPSDRPNLKLQTKPSPRERPHTLDPSCTCFARYLYSRAARSHFANTGFAFMLSCIHRAVMSPS